MALEWIKIHEFQQTDWGGQVMVSRAQAINARFTIQEGPNPGTPVCVRLLKMDNKTKILIMDDHPAMCRGIAQLISNEPDLMASGESADSRRALAGPIPILSKKETDSDR
jgi:hypothetical protein